MNAMSAAAVAGAQRARRRTVARALVRVGRACRQRGWALRGARAFQEALCWDPGCGVSPEELRLVPLAGFADDRVQT